MTDPILELVAVLRERAEDCADRALRRLAEAMPAMRDVTVPAGVRADLTALVHLTLTMLGQDRQPTAAELAACRRAGAQLTQLGVPFDDLERGLQIVYRVVWELVCDLAADHPDRRSPQLLMERTARIWSSLDQLIAALSDGHREVVDRIELTARRRSLAWLTALRDGDPGAHERTRELGLDPGGAFLVAVHAGHHDGGLDNGWRVVVELSDHTAVVAQPDGDPVEAELAAARALAPLGVAGGVGLTRNGLDGARQSLNDAMGSYRAALQTGAGMLCFREAWLTTLAVEHRGEHEPLVGAAVDLIRAEPRLAEVLRAFLRQNGNLSRTGKSIDLHPNTVAYRLRQFADRTRVDPRSASGLAFAQMAMALAGAWPGDEASRIATSAGQGR